MTPDKFPRARKTTDTQPLPPEVVEFALSFKQPERLAALPDPEEFAEFSYETRQILKARTVGNQAVKTVLDSYVESTVDVSTPLSNEAVRGIVTDSKRSMETLRSRGRNVLAYINVLPGSFPPDTWPVPQIGNHDVILTQAFGRNSIPDKDLPEVREAHEATDSDAGTMEYLDTQAFDTGASNRALARILAEDLKNPDTLREHVLQWEVAYALRELDADLYEKHQEALHVLWPKGNFYPTFDVKADSVKIMDEVGLYNALEFAHPDMMVRAAAILGKLGVAADVLAAEIPFDPKSVQKQVRGKAPWMVRETLARAEHVAFGRVKF